MLGGATSDGAIRYTSSDVVTLGVREVVEVAQRDSDGKTVAREADGLEHEHGSGSVVVRKVHEADKIVIPKFPKVTNLKQWRIGVCRGLLNASGRSDAAEIPWLLKATGGTKKYDDLEDSGDPRFRTLDQKLAVALVATVKAECQILATKLQTLDEKALFRASS